MVHEKNQNHASTNRRKFLATAAALSLTGLAGCNDVEDPAFQESDTVTLQPGKYHAVNFEVPEQSPGPSYAISWEARGRGEDTKFGVYIFEAGSFSEFATYEEFVNDETEESPSADISTSKARIEAIHSYEKLHLDPGEYAFVIDNTDYRGWGDVQGYPPTDSELEVEYKIEIPINLPDIIRERA